MEYDLHQEAWKALKNNDYASAARNWLEGFCFPDSRIELEEIFQYVNDLNEKTPNPDLCAILGLIALDHNEIFESDRERALMQCLDWSIRGIDLNSQHYYCNRNAGSALYWLNDMKGALKYYENSHKLRSSPVLQIRMFNIRNANNEFPDFAELTVSLDTDSAMEAYNAGVEMNWILERNPGMPENQHERLTLLKKQLYERAYHLYRNTLILGNGDRLNYDPHTFAMCCNNLARELNFEGAYQEAIAVASEGIGQSAFMFILLNRMNSYVHANMPENAIDDAITLLEDYGDEMDVITIISVIDSLSISYMDIKEYEQALSWADKGLEIYYQLDPTDPIMQDETITRCVTNFFINKSKSSAELGLAVDHINHSQETDFLLEEMPDNPSLMISRADAFVKEGEWQKAMECYDQAIHFGLEKGQERSVQVALYNRGYIHEAHLKNSEAALENFEQSIHSGNTDFWCYYWAVHSAYYLLKNEKTVHYGKLAVQALSGKESITDDVIAEIYEHIGTSQIDLGYYDEAVKNLQQSLKLNFSQTASDNLKIAQYHAGNSGGFFKKLFGK
ncbi:hypothetical protein MKJ01_11595 [Chryseobacterium sp. SSA4.19]|uniref:tetratricopeptide repeat protein n=1 Tax=Chryseobacterium sp. SSA4.19 TaxID=2919915 RepID=UPI001F4EF232|nr:hypothetical protein [Chryseobacterium sp. SSA4.19]MCJ8154405.1 hypothetical protein [Chryseobacterium sp. SSA4.19]